MSSTKIRSILETSGIDAAITSVGDFNKYQFKLMFFLGVQWLIASWVLMIQPFLTEVPVFLCQDSTDPSKTKVCSEQDACKQSTIRFQNQIDNVVTQFELYCDRAYLRNLSGSIFFFGGGMGTVIFSYIADKWGRKTAIMMANSLGAVAWLLLSLFSTSIVSFYVFLGLSWAGFDAYFAFSLIILSESGGSRLREFSNPFLLAIWGAGLCIFVGIAYCIQNWKDESLYVIGIPACLAIICSFQIHESPRFLFAQGKLDECQAVLEDIAKQNGRLKDGELLLPNAAPEEDNVAVKQEQENEAEIAASKNNNYLVLVTNPWLRKRFLLFTLMIMYIYLSYNGILFGLSSLGGDIYMNSIIVSIAELLGYLASFVVLSRVKRIASFAAVMTMAASGSILYAVTPHISCQSSFVCSTTFLLGAASLIIKFAVSLSFGLIFVYGSELFPTTTRSKCVGLAASCGRVSGLFITWINQALTSVGIAPVLFYGSLGFVMLIVLKFLPETFGCVLLQDIPENISRKKIAEAEEDRSPNQCQEETAINK